MTLALIHTRALDGLHAPPVMVEVHVANGLPAFSLVGLADAEVREARDRVRAALLSSGFEFPARRITVNLAPADLPKDSGRFDLPIALGLLAASGQLPALNLNDYEFAGELSLTGSLRPVRGALGLALASHQAGRTLILPEASGAEAALAEGAAVRVAHTLREVCAHLMGEDQLPHPKKPDLSHLASYPDLSEVKGQAQARRALEIAATGGHALLMLGPPGTGKSMLATRLPGILPPLQPEAALISAGILSLSGTFNPERFGERPFRAPHHSASPAAVIGGGSQALPGEISLATSGVLFLDELPEFDRRVLESLREPLETGEVHIARANRRATYPAAFQLIAAMNPCPCGYQGHPTRACRCTPEQIQRYRNRLSGPLLDRIDLCIEVPALSSADLSQATPGESSAAVRERVAAAASIALRRQGSINARLEGKDLDTHAKPDTAGQTLLNQAVNRLGLSARAYHRLLRVARTIADLASAEHITAAHIGEAIQFRQLFSN
ncbi:YifB family Mg chelatase-like AAA ATPase [Fluviibacter phosphoraccumulans]|uniref:ATP-dependent protease n=1 Tax=Fluviibacter phosphoraccumulans TaxID=1751046 RepID=A0A679I8U4_9RHOO|nr:YifB family Mg chelatase-like AAA ATPase [Fluviibacter phosphoraccumulans]BBU68291.1 ATP-dependent protease [Fluviibacter phosphoraccumulans]BBU70170.1 ATP-dependent protease [Fluviibacter phosphoraccumulans]BCA66474.1 ATP-dependent protease [Fluviibacter phosphoraccumulans]